MKKILFILSLLFIASSCTNYLDPYPNADRDGEQLWNYATNVQGLIGQAYEGINSNNRNYRDNEGAFLDGATDDAVITSTTENMYRLAVNSLNTANDPFQTYWDRDYKALYLVNLFLKDDRGYHTRYLVNPHFNDMLRTELHGEAFALRAYFYWDLMQKFGGKGTNGQLLGVPLIIEPSDVTADNNWARETYDNCMKQIIKDCDSALLYLPTAHRDFLVSDPNDLSYAGGKYWGRFDDQAVRGIKAMLYLTWASPRFNPSNDISRWDSAAANAKKVIDFKLNVDFVRAVVLPQNGVTWTDPNNPEIVFTTRYNNNNSDWESDMLPNTFKGKGRIGPTQELVDAFPDANGVPIASSTLYDATKPYLNRDPRFYATIFYNTSLHKKDNTGTTWYTFEMQDNGGKDRAGASPSNTRTNYYIKKFIYMGFNPTASSSQQTKAPHSKFIIRWAHMLLTFAEAANQVVGPTDAAKYGMSAQTAIQYLRARKTNFNFYNGFGPAVPLAPDANLSSVAALGKADFDKLVKNERRIETCFEGLRFFDLRRWTTDLTDLNKPVHGAAITKNTDGTFTYDLTPVVEERIFTSAFWPIPYQEMLRMSNLIQNEGWDSWN